VLLLSALNHNPNHSLSHPLITTPNTAQNDKNHSLAPRSNLWARPEATDDLFGRADANLNVIQLPKASTLIQFPSLHEKAANGVKRRLALFLPKLVEHLHDHAVQISRPEFRAAILGDWSAILGAYSHINVMRLTDLFERLRIGQIEAVAEIK
jgi:hypothetical protein